MPRDIKVIDEKSISMFVTQKELRESTKTMEDFQLWLTEQADVQSFEVDKDSALRGYHVLITFISDRATAGIKGCEGCNCSDEQREACEGAESVNEDSSEHDCKA